MLPHDSTDLRAFEERRRDMEREIKALNKATLIKKALISQRAGAPAALKMKSPWWGGLCTGCGEKLERLGKKLICLGEKLRDTAGAAGFQA